MQTNSNAIVEICNPQGYPGPAQGGGLVNFFLLSFEHVLLCHEKPSLDHKSTSLFTVSVISLCLEGHKKVSHDRKLGKGGWVTYQTVAHVNVDLAHVELGISAEDSEGFGEEDGSLPGPRLCRRQQLAQLVCSRHPHHRHWVSAELNGCRYHLMLHRLQTKTKESQNQIDSHPWTPHPSNRVHHLCTLQELPQTASPSCPGSWSRICKGSRQLYCHVLTVREIAET